MAFGDWNDELGELHDFVRSNNDDRDRVLATVAYTVLDFIKHYPDAIIFAKGETSAKTRLYQIGINANWYEISHLLEVKGYINGAWENFSKIKIMMPLLY